MNSFSAGIGIMMVSRRPPTSSVIFRNRPRLFSFKSMKKILAIADDLFGGDGRVRVGCFDFVAHEVAGS